MSSITRTTGSPIRNTLAERLRSAWQLPQTWPAWRIWVYLACEHRFYVFPGDRRRFLLPVDRRPSQAAARAHQHRDSQRERALMLLRASAASFQEWRRYQGFPPLWLTGADLSGLALTHVDWQGCVLVRVRFDHADLTGCRFTGAVLREVSWHGATLAGVIWEGQDLGVSGLPPNEAPETANRWLRPASTASVRCEAPMVRLPRLGLRLSLAIENRAAVPQEVVVTVCAGEAQRTASIQLSPHATRPLTIKLKRVASGEAVRAKATAGGQEGEWVPLGFAPRD